jgi:hypothetical protein
MQSVLKEIVLSNVIVNHNTKLKPYDYSFCISVYKELIDKLSKLSINDFDNRDEIEQILNLLMPATEERDYHRYCKLLKYIKNQTYEIYLLAIEGDLPDSLAYIKKQSEQQIRLALSLNGFVLRHIKNLDKYPIDTIMEFYKIAIMQTPFSVEYIIDKPEYPRDKMNEIYKIALKYSGHFIQYIQKPTYELCLIATQNYSNAILFMDKTCLTCEEVQQLWKIAYPQ